MDVWPLDDSNVALLDAVHPRDWKDPEPPSSEAEYDLIAIGAGAGGLVSSKQSARRGARKPSPQPGPNPNPNQIRNCGLGLGPNCLIWKCGLGLGKTFLIRQVEMVTW